MTAGDWIGICAIVVPVFVALIGVIFRLGRVVETVNDVDERVGRIEDWIFHRPKRGSYSD